MKISRIVHDHGYAITEVPKINEDSPEKFQALNNNIVCFMNEQHIPGAALAISYHGKLIYSQGYGQAGPGRPVLSSSKFRLASISKPITASVIMVLVQAGHIQLDSLVFGCKGLLPEYRPRSKGDKRLLRITVRHLLQHSAGWDRDMVGDHVFWNLEKILPPPLSKSREGLLNYIMTRKLQFSPGKRHSYSNLGYLVLGIVIETLSGMSYTDCIYNYLGTTIDMIFEGREIKQELHWMEVGYYDNRMSGILNSVIEEHGHVEPQYGSFAMKQTGSYGGLVASAVHLLDIFDQILSTQSSVLSSTSIGCMLAPPTYAHGDAWYGLGLDVQDGGHSYGHTGAMEGTSCTWLHHKSGLSWTLLLNAWSRDLDLDGLIKYSLSQVQGLPLNNPSSALLMSQNFDFQSCGTNVLIFSKDAQQAVHVLLPLCDLDIATDNLKGQGYLAKHINIVVIECKMHVNIIWQKHTHILPWSIKSTTDKNVLNDCHGNIICLDTCFLDNTFYCIYAFKNIKATDQKILMGLDEKLYLQELASARNEGWELIIQSVAVDAQDHLKVTAVFDKKSAVLEQVTWLQITMENFIFELGRQSEHGLSLQYMKVFETCAETYVSAIWSNHNEKPKCFHRADVSRFGFLYELCQSCTDNMKIAVFNGYISDNVLNFASVWSSDTKK